ncbi:unnamed protein product [Brachionus calyciflorus]|uniref:CUE domain-containing protein n=1 Tax=Brachionus calyciflorus TaxID=104777 RepID=A0A814JK36_9BILA|nr:unnamed protein product [Brachionus calyciflorus]
MEKLTSLSHVSSTNDSEWKTKSRPKTNRKTKSPTSMNNKASMDNESYTEYNKDQISLIKYYVTNRIKVLVLMRGPSGSGKSTLAKRLKPENQGMIISADNYFYNHASKTYVFDKNKLNDAHIDCRLKASNAMKNLISPVIIDNTNIKIWEFKPYVKLAVKHNYQIEIIEPSTPWKTNANMLFQKNIHKVEIHTIRRTISDYENVDLPKLINECQNEIKKEEDSKKPRAPSGILSNFDDIVKTNDWSTTNESNLKLSSAFVSSSLILDKRLTDIQQNKPSFYLNESIACSKSTDITTTTDSEYFDCKSKDESLMNGLNKSEEEEDDEFKSFSLYESSSNSSDALTEELKDSLNILKSMFPDIQDDIIIDFLIKYENDVNMVTNILLDSFNFSSTLSEPEKAPDLCKKKINQKEIVEDKKEALVVGRNFFQVKSLQELCRIEMEKLEMAMENLNSRIQQAKSAVFKPNSSSDSNSSSPVSSCKIQSETFARSNSVPKDFVNNHHNGLSNGFKENKKDIEEDDEPIIYLKVDKLKCLVDLFGTKDELENVNGNCEIPIDLELAFKIYQSWKKTQKPASKVQHKISSDYLNFDNQIENDEKLSMELFEATNMRDPIEKVPVFLSEKGINPAQLSLRQIMAEEMAEQRKEQMVLNSFDKKSVENLTFFESIKFKKKVNEKSSNQINALKNNINNGNQSENIANRIKLKDLYETYENLVDRKMIDDIFKKKK